MDVHGREQRVKPEEHILQRSKEEQDHHRFPYEPPKGKFSSCKWDKVKKNLVIMSQKN